MSLSLVLSAVYGVLSEKTFWRYVQIAGAPQLLTRKEVHDRPSARDARKDRRSRRVGSVERAARRKGGTRRSPDRASGGRVVEAVADDRLVRVTVSHDAGVTTVVASERPLDLTAVLS
jgi:hypothetical protein